jgi:hypothetical protein
MKNIKLSKETSFYVPAWTAEFADTAKLYPAAIDPLHNVAVLLQRVKLVHACVRESFAYTSGVYIGKTSRQRISDRFTMHLYKVAGKDASIVMVTLATFADADVPPTLANFGVRGESLALLYETLLTTAAAEAGLPPFADDTHPGGGKMSKADFGLVYVLMIVSNEPVE